MTDLTVVLGVIELAKQYLDFKSSDNFRMEITDNRVSEFSHLLFPVLEKRERIAHIPKQIIDVKQYQEPVLQEYVRSLIQTVNLRSSLLTKNPIRSQDYLFNTICWAKLLKNVMTKGRFIEDVDKDGVTAFAKKLSVVAKWWSSERGLAESIRERKFNSAEINWAQNGFKNYLIQLHFIRPAAVQALHEFMFMSKRMVSEQSELPEKVSINLASMAVLISPCLLDALQLRGKLNDQMAPELYFFAQVTGAILAMELFEHEYKTEYYPVSTLVQDFQELKLVSAQSTDSFFTEATSAPVSVLFSKQHQVGSAKKEIDKKAKKSKSGELSVESARSDASLDKKDSKRKSSF